MTLYNYEARDMLGVRAKKVRRIANKRKRFEIPFFTLMYTTEELCKVLNFCQQFNTGTRDCSGVPQIRLVNALRVVKSLNVLTIATTYKFGES